MRLARAFGFALVLGVACQGNVDLAMEITVPSDVTSKVKWFEVAAYRDASCDALAPMLMNGLPEGLTARSAFQKSSDAGPVFGKIPSGRYAFAAVARDKDCAVLARGCTEEDTGSTSKVTIDLQATSRESGKCTAGTSCQAARCVPSNANEDPSVGIGCSLELLGAGPLLHIAEGGALMSAPSIATTKTGFVIAYRENEGSGGAARMILLPIDTAGGLYGADKRELQFEQTPILDQCGRERETDGVGLAMAGENGFLVAANTCSRSGGPNLQLVPFDVRVDPDDRARLIAVPLGNSFVSPTGGIPTLGAARSTSLDAQVVFVEGGQAKWLQMSRTEAANAGLATPFGAATEAWMAANEQILALLTVENDGTPQGADAAQLKLYMSAKGVPPTKDTPTDEFPGRWGSIAALGGRVLVLSNGSGPSESAEITVYDFGQNENKPTDTTGFSVAGDGPLTAGDATIVGNRAYFAALKAGVVELHVFDSASTKLVELSSASLGREPRISGINAIGDGRVAVAASSTRVAVAWTTKKQLDDQNNDPPGGYAVFACTQ